MTQPNALEVARLGLLEPIELGLVTTAEPQGDLETPELDDELRPDRSTGQSDPWHGLDDFED
jgi:hypothetical protein